MGGGVSVPPPSPQELQLQQNQADLLKLQRQIIEQQRTQNAVLIPFFAEQEGYKVATDKYGNITAISKTPTELERMEDELEMELTKRSLAAVKGELPVSPGLERELTQQERVLREQLSQQFGPGYETSTPGIQSMEQFRTTAEVLREGARTAQLTLAEQLGIAREQQNRFMQSSSQDFLRQIAGGDPLTLAGAFGQTAAGFGQAQAPFIQHRQMQLQAAIANQQARTSLIGAGIGAIGALFSDERMKPGGSVIGYLQPYGVPIREYWFNGEWCIGVFASDVEAAAPGHVGERFGYKTVQYEGLS